MRRILWLLLGHLALVLGVIGIFLPLLPTTPFLLLAALAFSRSSPRLSRWLHDHPRLGPPIHDWRDHGVIGAGAKRLVVAAVALSIGLSVWLAIPWWALTVQAMILAAVLAFVLSRPSRPKSGASSGANTVPETGIASRSVPDPGPDSASGNAEDTVTDPAADTATVLRPPRASAR